MQMADTPTLATQALGVVDLTIQACNAYGRDDLAARLAHARAELTDPAVHVVVVGEFKQGKSSLVNALVNADVCPVDDDIATSVPTFVRYGDEPSATVLFDTGAERPEDAERVPITIEQIREYVTEQQRSDPRPVQSVEVRLPRKLLAGGLVIVDTPGVGGLGSAHATATLGALPFADAVLFVSDASQEFTRTELDFLKQAIEMCPTVVCVLTKMDFYPAWRKIRDLDVGHLAREGVQAELVPVSSPLRLQAVRTNDRELNAESGFTQVVRFITDQVAGGAEVVVAKEAVAEVGAVVGMLRQTFESEKAALTDPETAQEIVRQLTETKERADRLRGQAAKWNQTLSDGVADLSADVDHDFRSRIRKLLAETDEAIDNSDPADTWGEFEPWLYARVSHDVVANYAFLRDQARELSERVAEHFAEGGGDVLDRLAVYNPMGVLTESDATTGLSMQQLTTAKKGLAALRGAYSGFAMFTLLGSMIGISAAVLTPFAGGIALVLGRNALRDEKERQLKMRQAQAKNTVRRFADEVTFAVNKDSRDTLRRIQRQMRDFYSTRADELSRSTTTALASAQEAVKQTAAEREKRIRDIDAELNRLKQLEDRNAKVAAAAASPTPAPAEVRP